MSQKKKPQKKNAQEKNRMQQQNREPQTSSQYQDRTLQELDRQRRLTRRRMMLTPVFFVIAFAVFAATRGERQDAESEEQQAAATQSAAGTAAGTEAAEGTGAEKTAAGVAAFSAEALPDAWDISKDALTYAQISVKDYGTITMALDETIAPTTVENFVSLVKEGFYDGLTFHRIMDGFMIQGGDPLGNGTGGSDETIRGEFAANGFDNPITHVRGAVSMARSQDMDSASSQFFLVQADSTFLDGQYAGFGYVTDGMDVVDAICKDAEPVDSNGTIPKEQQPVIESIVIAEPAE